jgi:hypothetical protein
MSKRSEALLWYHFDATTRQHATTMPLETDAYEVADRTKLTNESDANATINAMLGSLDRYERKSRATTITAATTRTKKSKVPPNSSMWTISARCK